MQYKTAALEDLCQAFMGWMHAKLLVKLQVILIKHTGMLHMQASLEFREKRLLKSGLVIFLKAIPGAKPEIITMLGNRGDEAALPLIKSSLSDSDLDVRKEAAAAIAKMSGSEAVTALIELYDEIQ